MASYGLPGVTPETGNNYSPIEELIRSPQRTPKIKGFSSVLKQLRKELKTENQSEWDSHLLKWLRTSLYYTGQQFLRKSTYGLGYDSVPHGERDDVYINNKLRFNSDQVTVKWSQSEAELEFRPADTDDERAVGIARQGSLVYEHYARKFYTEAFLNTEAKLAQFCGNYARYFYYDALAKGGSYEQPQVENTQNQVPGAQQCIDCGAAGPPTGSCPQCGSPNVQQIPGTSLESQSVTGYQNVQTGDLCCESVPFWELRFDLGRRLEDSPWLLRFRRVRVDELQQAYPEVNITRKPASETQTQIQDRLRRNAGTGQTSASYTRVDGGHKDNFVDFEQWWFDSCMLDFQIEKDTELANGQTIPAGSSLKDIFPDGLYCAFVSGIEAPVDVRPECHRRFWVSGQFNPVPGRGLGDGIEDAIEPQRQHNMLGSLRYTHYRTTASPTIIVNGRMIQATGYIGKPGMTHVVKPGNLPEDGNVASAVSVIPMPPLPGDFLQYQEALSGEMQIATKAVDFSNALPGVDNRTATGATIGNNLAQSLHSPQLALRAEVDRASAYVILDLFKSFVPEERYLQIKGRYGTVEGVWLRAADLQEVSFDINVKGHSYMPKSEQDRQQDLTNALTLIGGVAGLQQAPRSLVQELAECYGVDFGDETLTAARRLAQIRLDQMKQAFPQVIQTMMLQMQNAQMTGMLPPGFDLNATVGQTLVQAIRPPVSAFEKGFADAVEFLATWLSTDEGIEAEPLLRAGVEMLMVSYTTASLEQQRINLAVSEALLVGPVEAMIGEKAQEVVQMQQQQQMRQQQGQAGSPQETEAQAAPNRNAKPKQSNQGRTPSKTKPEKSPSPYNRKKV